ncbi:MAG: hypothetical protein ABJH04_07985 [Cyclobacteriaceae bacterium]
MKISIEFIPKEAAYKIDKFLKVILPSAVYFLKINGLNEGEVWAGITESGIFQSAVPTETGNDQITEGKTLDIAIEPLLKWLHSEGLLSIEEVEAVREYIQFQ